LARTGPRGVRERTCGEREIGERLSSSWLIPLAAAAERARVLSLCLFPPFSTTYTLSYIWYLIKAAIVTVCVRAVHKNISRSSSHKIYMYIEGEQQAVIHREKEQPKENKKPPSQQRRVRERAEADAGVSQISTTTNRGSHN
jgi:hypothetical protein